MQLSKCDTSCLYSIYRDYPFVMSAKQLTRPGYRGQNGNHRYWQSHGQNERAGSVMCDRLEGEMKQRHAGLGGVHQTSLHLLEYLERASWFDFLWMLKGGGWLRVAAGEWSNAAYTSPFQFFILRIKWQYIRHNLNYRIVKNALQS